MSIMAVLANVDLEKSLNSLVSDEIKKMTQAVAYAALVVALMWDAISTRGDGILQKILKTAILVGAIAYYDTVLVAGCTLFDTGCEAARKSVQDTLNVIQSAKFKDGGMLEGIGAWFIYMGVRGFCGLTWAAQWISINFFRVFFMACLSVTAPIVIGLGSIKIFEHLLPRFAGYTLAVMMWSVGFAIVDKVLAQITSSAASLLAGSAVLGTSTGVASLAALGTGATLGAPAWIPLLILAMTMAFSACFFYLMAPVAMFAILGGGNPGMAMWGGMSGGAGMGAGVAQRVGQAATEAVAAHTASSTGANTSPSSSAGTSNSGAMASGSSSARIRQGVKNIGNGGA